MSRLLAASLCLVILATGCAQRSVQVRGIVPLNVNDEGESTPVDVRFYQLRDEAAFARAGFAALWSDPAATLGHALIGTPVVATVLPGGAADPAVAVPLGGGEAAWIGIQLLVRREGDLPRTLLMPATRLGACAIEVHGYGLRLVERR